MSSLETIKEVTVVSVDRTYMGCGRIKHGDLLKLVEQINGGAQIIKLDSRFGGHVDRYVPVSRIAEIQVER